MNRDLTKLEKDVANSSDDEGSICVYMKSLEYGKYCLKESLRLFPPVYALGRELTQPTKEKIRNHNHMYVGRSFRGEFCLTGLMFLFG